MSQVPRESWQILGMPSNAVAGGNGGPVILGAMRHEDLLAETDWSVAGHACGTMPGVPQTPEILAALLSRDVAVQVRALRDLHQLVLHQDTIYPATPPAVDFVVAILGDRRALTAVPPDSRRGAGVVPLRAELLGWLTAVMEAAAEHEQWPPAGGPAEVAACRAARPRVYPPHAHGAPIPTPPLSSKPWARSRACSTPQSSKATGARPLCGCVSTPWPRPTAASGSWRR